MGVFRNSSGSTPPAHFCGGGGPLRNMSIPLPRPDDLLGVLHVPLHCVNLTELQQEIKLRLPVANPSPPGRQPSEHSGHIPDGGERELSVLLSPICSLDTLEEAFRNGLTANTTGANRCNVMLFRLSGSAGSFLSSSDALFQAALRAPLTPSIASTARQRPLHSPECHNAETAKPQQHLSDGSQVELGAVGVEVSPGTGAVALSRLGRPDVPELGASGRNSPGSPEESMATSVPAAALRGEPTPGRPASPTCGRAPPVDSAGSVASLQLPTKDQQGLRHQRRQQELSVAAVLAASAIAAAARGERGRSSRSSASRQPSESQRLIAGLGMRGNDRPSSVCGVVARNSRMQHEAGSSLSMQSQLLGHQPASDLEQLWNLPSGSAGAYRSTGAAGDPDLFPDDSVSVRGHCLAAAIVSCGGGNAQPLSSSSLRGRLAARDCGHHFDSFPDDRKSTLSTSIRRLDCLMTRAQLLLSQRHHRQKQREGQQQLADSNHQQLSQDKRSDHKERPSASTPCPSDSGQRPSTFVFPQSPTVGRSGSLRPSPIGQPQEVPVAGPQALSVDLAPSDNFPPGGCVQTTQAPQQVSKCSAVAKTAKWVQAAACRRLDLLTQR